MTTPQFKHLGSNLKIDQIEIDNIKPYANNARTHSKDQIKQIARSIETFGFTNPVLIDGDNNIIAGHGRIEGAKHIGLKQVPTIRLDYLSEAQKKAYIIADNKLAENAGWDMDILQNELDLITNLDIDFDLTLTGFETAEIDNLFDLNASQPEEMLKIDIPEKPVSQLDDVWLLGRHKVICGDATKEGTYQTLLDDQKADLVFTDPPYNVPVDGHVGGNGRVKHDEFQMASGEMSSAEFTAFLEKTFKQLCAFTCDGSIHYICMDWRHMREMLNAGDVYTDFKNLCVWNKTNGGMGSFYRSKHELVFVFKNGNAPHTNNIQLGKHGRYRTNVWDYAGVNTFQNNKDLAMHPTVKPTQMIKDAILDCSKRGDIVLDAFGGSGSTLIAAEECHRTAYIIELEPKYVDVMIKRYQDLTGKEAVHEDGQTFSKIKEVRDV